MADTPLQRRSRRLANKSPSPSGELPTARRRTQQNTVSQSLSTTIPAPDTGSSHVAPTELSAASSESPATPVPRLTARAACRNVHIFDNQKPPVEIGGLHVTRGVSNQLLYDMTAVLVVEPVYSWRLRDERNQQVLRDNNPVQSGNYYIISNSEQVFFLLLF
ncbi:hypothetical protein VTN77DRAFT_4256 [Rasamsonia byssochlamydoides]|uniref:uncharacterized protein n=1 Tax=Rasamsonia byssochlamydoides TaxID=89139 RepID=UPI0037424B6D